MQRNIGWVGELPKRSKPSKSRVARRLVYTRFLSQPSHLRPPRQAAIPRHRRIESDGQAPYRQSAHVASPEPQSAYDVGDGPTEPIGSSVGINRSVGVKQNPRDVNPEDALSFEGDDALARMFRAEEAWNEAKIEADARATVKSQELGKVIDAYHTPLIEFIKREFGLNDASNRQLKQLEKQFNDAKGEG